MSTTTATSEEVTFKDPHVCIDGAPYPVRFGYRSYAIFAADGSTLADVKNDPGVLLKLYYSGIVAGCNRNRIPAPDYETYMNALDDDAELFESIKAIYEQDNVVKK